MALSKLVQQTSWDRVWPVIFGKVAERKRLCTTLRMISSLAAKIFLAPTKLAGNTYKVT